MTEGAESWYDDIHERIEADAIAEIDLEIAEFGSDEGYGIATNYRRWLDRGLQTEALVIKRELQSMASRFHDRLGCI